MNVIITINTENDAFVSSPPLEVARILTELAKKLREEEVLRPLSLQDMNGNKIGEMQHVGDTWNY